MSITRYSACAVGFGIALVLTAGADAGAQTDTTRRPTAVAEERIPVRKDQGLTRRMSAGEVFSVERARIDSLEAMAATYRQRLDALEASNASLTSSNEATARMVAALADSLRLVRSELTSARSELTANIARTNAVADSLLDLNQRFWRFRNGSLFGHSGFYVGIGSGTNMTIGTLDNIGYQSGLNVSVPIGWHKRGNVIGIRTEFGVQSFDGRNASGFSNPDPRFYSAVGMLTLNLPINAAKTNTFYLMGGAGLYMFRNITAGSTLADRLGAPSSGSSTTSETKLGLTGGAGLEFKILGATSFFVQSAITNVSVEASTRPGADAGKSLRWVPLIAGIQLR